MTVISSFRLHPNSADGGEVLRLSIEGFKSISEAEPFLNKECKIRFYEVDGRNKSAKFGKKDDLLAEFTANIVLKASIPMITWGFEDVIRMDKFENKLPMPKTRKVKDSTGTEIELKYKPDWRPPHFILSHDLGKNLMVGGAPKLHVVLLQGSVLEREKYIYEIAVQILVDGKEKFSSRRFPTRLDCNKQIAHNCKEATKMMLDDHQELVKKRGIGTNYGSQFSPSDYAKFKAQKKKFGLTNSSCIVYLLEACERAHKESYSTADWKKIRNHMKEGTGPTLAKGLEKWGWVGLYFNQDVNHPFDLDWSERKWARNHHKAGYRQAQGRGRKKGTYGEERLKVQDMIINFRPTIKYQKWDLAEYPDFGKGVKGARGLNGKTIASADRTKKESAKVNRLKKVPFGLVNAKDGLHTAIIVFGKVYEVHWDKGPDDELLYEATDFEKDWGWITGIIHVPAGTW